MTICQEFGTLNKQQYFIIDMTTFEINYIIHGMCDMVIIKYLVLVSHCDIVFTEHVVFFSDMVITEYIVLGSDMVISDYVMLVRD